MNDKLTYIFIGIFLITGLIALVLGARDLFDLSKYYNNSNSIKAVYKDAIVSGVPIKDEPLLYNLIYSYNVDGKDYEITTNYATNFMPKEGDTITIIYNVDNPGEAFIPKDFLFSFILGLLFVVGSLFVLIRKLKKVNIKDIKI